MSVNKSSSTPTNVAFPVFMPGACVCIFISNPEQVASMLAGLSGVLSGNSTSTPLAQPGLLLTPKAFARRYHMRIADAYAISKVPEIRVVRPWPGSRRVKIDVNSYEEWRRKHPSGLVDRPDAQCA